MTETPLYYTLSALGYPLNLIVITLLWLAARRTTQNRPFVTLLALGWTIGLSGNIAWIVYEMLGNAPIPALSWVDSFYLARYAVLLAAFLFFAPAPAPTSGATPSSRRIWMTVLVTALAAGLVTLELYQSRATLPPTLVWPLVLGYAIYPVLDIALLYAAWSLDARETHQRHMTSLLLLAMACYSTANWINLAIHLLSADAVPSLPTFFWLACDLLAGGVALSIIKPKTSEVSKSLS